MEAPFRTTHHLNFYDAPYVSPNQALLDAMLEAGLAYDDDPTGIPWRLFRIGTCEGQWRCTEDAYEILTLVNTVPGNGHFDDVMQWFEHACVRDNKLFRIKEIMNPRLMRHLLRKRGFRRDGRADCVKRVSAKKGG